MQKQKSFSTNHTELRKRVSLDLSLPVMTDQSDKNSSDINYIMQNYQKTGLLPQTQNKIAQYIDNTNLPSLEEAHAQIQEAKQLFMELPAQVRKLMDNNPQNLLSFITNKENEDILLKHGLITKKEKIKVDVSEPKQDPTSVSASANQEVKK